MSIIPMSIQNIQMMAQNDAQELRRIITWVEERYQSYNQNMTTQNMTTAGISPEDQATMLAFIGDLNRLKMIANNTLPANSTDMKYDCAAVLGIL